MHKIWHLILRYVPSWPITTTTAAAAAYLCKQYDSGQSDLIDRNGNIY